jgi:hypothetical protein
MVLSMLMFVRMILFFIFSGIGSVVHNQFSFRGSAAFESAESLYRSP